MSASGLNNRVDHGAGGVVQCQEQGELRTVIAQPFGLRLWNFTGSIASRRGVKRGVVGRTDGSV